MPAVHPLAVTNELCKLVKVGRSEAGDEIPARSGGEAVRAASNVAALGDVGESLVALGVEHRVQPAERGLAAVEAVVVHQRNNGGESL